MARIITLTTDFGNRDWFVASMKGVIKSIAPDTEVIDVSHEIPAGDVRAASFVLAAAMPYFPKGTIHAAVVDPGVGTKRRAIAVQGKRSLLVGPDNGVLTLPMEADAPVHAVELAARKYFLGQVSATFHGRDVFAPVAAHLSRGVPLLRMGRPIRRPQRLDLCGPVLRNGAWRGEIVYIDRFGNAVTNVDGSKALTRPPAALSRKRERAGVRGDAGGTVGAAIHVGRWRVEGIHASYEAGRDGRLIAVVNSLGLIELAVRGGDAATQYRLRPGQAVEIELG